MNCSYLDIPKGSESLRYEANKNCAEAGGSLHEDGCIDCLKGADKQCFHKYCNKYKWVIDRAGLYAKHCGKSIEEILTIWETDRTYWFMNYYQDCNQPVIDSTVWLYDDWKAKMELHYGADHSKWEFKCAKCGNVQTIQDFIDAGVDEPTRYAHYSCIGRHKEGVGCNWTIGGLLSTGKEVRILQGGRIFKSLPSPWMDEHEGN